MKREAGILTASAFKDFLTFKYDLHCNELEEHVKTVLKRASLWNC
jgi:hypothetical protein